MRKAVFLTILVIVFVFVFTWSIQNALAVYDGLVGHWVADNCPLYDGSILYDKSWVGNHGTLVGFSTTTNACVPGKVGNALDFDGADDYVDLGTGVDYLANGGTICWWSKDWSGGTIISRSLGTDLEKSMGRGGYVLRQSGTSGYFRTRYSQGTYSDADYLIADGVWRFYCLTFDNTGRQYWRNGVVFGAKGTAQTELPAVAATTTLIGMAGGNYFNGSIDEPRIYNRVLTEAEVSMLYEMGEPLEPYTEGKEFMIIILYGFAFIIFLGVIGLFRGKNV